MFTLTTGVPGAGKTLYVLYLLAIVKDITKHPETGLDRPIYYFGIPELSEDLGWVLLNGPKKWHEDVVDAAIVVIDECQQHFPLRLARDPVPEGLRVIETHRHRGLDLFFITQHSSLLDVHARRLVGQHFHLKRNFGAGFAVVYKANECITDPQDNRQLDRAEKNNFRYPKEVFSLYKSAEVHTHKFKIPRVVLWLMPLIAIIIFSVVMAKDILQGKSQLAPVQVESGISSVMGSDDKILTLDSFVPLIENIPASSLAYQKKWKPQSVPIVSSCIGSGDKCRCYSQQGTLIVVTVDYCQYVLINGSPYDHTLKDNRFKSKGKK